MKLPILITNFKVKMIACSSHIIIIATNGVYGYGRNDSGELRIGHNNEVKDFTEVKIKNVKYVSCGIQHTIFLSFDGSVYGCGKTKQGQYGFMDDENRNVPILINLYSKCLHVSCGENFTVFLLDNNKCYCCGDGYYGQLGNKIKTHSYNIILINSITEPVIYMTCGKAFTIFVTDKQRCFIIGTIDTTETLVNDSNNDNYIPREINVKPAVDVNYWNKSIHKYVSDELKITIKTMLLILKNLSIPKDMVMEILQYLPIY